MGFDIVISSWRPSGAGHEALDCTCEAVGGDKDSVTYECSYEVGRNAADGTRKATASRIQGKFAMNVP